MVVCRIFCTDVDGATSSGGLLVVTVTTIKILRVTFTNSLSVAEHVHNVISSCAQALYALRVLRAHGMDDASLQTIYWSVIIAKLTYASSAWWGYTIAPDRRLEAFVRPSEWSKRFRSSQFADLCRVVLGSWREAIWDRHPRQSIITFYINSCRHNRSVWSLNTTIFDNADITFLSLRELVI